MSTLSESTNTFKARPLNRKIMSSAGDLGVPRVIKAKPTMIKPFSLSERPSSARGPPKPSHEIERPLYSSFTKVATTPRVAGKPATDAKQRPASGVALPQQKAKAALPAAAAEILTKENEPASTHNADPVDASNANYSMAPASEPAASPPAPESSVAEPEEAAPQGLSLQAIKDIQVEVFADDVQFDASLMVAWNVQQVRAYFESGGALVAADPPTAQEAEAPSSPGPEFIRADEPPTPDTIEFQDNGL